MRREIFRDPRVVKAQPARRELPTRIEAEPLDRLAIRAPLQPLQHHHHRHDDRRPDLTSSGAFHQRRELETMKRSLSASMLRFRGARALRSWEELLIRRVKEPTSLPTEAQLAIVHWYVPAESSSRNAPRSILPFALSGNWSAAINWSGIMYFGSCLRRVAMMSSAEGAGPDTNATRP